MLTRKLVPLCIISAAAALFAGSVLVRSRPQGKNSCKNLGTGKNFNLPARAMPSG